MDVRISKFYNQLNTQPMSDLTVAVDTAEEGIVDAELEEILNAHPVDADFNEEDEDEDVSFDDDDDDDWSEDDDDEEEL